MRQAASMPEVTAAAEHGAIAEDGIWNGFGYTF